MTITQAQADVRRIYRGGYSGPLVSAILWGVANAVYFLVSPGAAMVTLFFGGMLIFPLSAVVLKLMSGESALPKGHPSIGLAMQSAFTIPLGLLVAIALGAYAPELFFPASLIIVGAHYLTFISLYGMKSFAALAGALVLVGTIALFFIPAIAPISGWVGAGVFAVFVPVLYRAGKPTGPQGD
ncbi:ABC transporter permease [Salinibacterium sp. NYA9b]